MDRNAHGSKLSKLKWTETTGIYPCHDNPSTFGFDTSRSNDTDSGLTKHFPFKKVTVYVSRLAFMVATTKSGLNWKKTPTVCKCRVAIVHEVS